MQARAYGKWILAGEHAVLRGCPALVFPVVGKSLELKYHSEDQPLHADFIGERGKELQLLFWGVVERGLEMVGRSLDEVRGRFTVDNTIPIGAGLGASAALCVAIGHWFVAKDWISENGLYEFSRELENLFHGESSGVDIAVAISGKGLHFERSGNRYELAPKWQPNWFLSYSGKRGVTSECIAKVKALWEKDQTLGSAIDLDMKESVALAEEALCAMPEERGLELLIASLNKARTCFERWGLADGEIARHMQELTDKGALAVKPTGSGDGGFVLSLWAATPPPELHDRLIHA